jgi:outer membrane lipoprotein SlyB
MDRVATARAAVLTKVNDVSGLIAQRGAVIGGLGGAAVGGIIGNQSGRGLEGALIGGAVGAAGGAAIGNSKDRQRRYY